MRNSLIIKDEKNQLKERNIAILDKCKLEIRDFNEDEKREYDSNIEKINELNEELRKLNESLNKEDNETKTNTNLNKMETKKSEFRLLKAINDIVNNRNLDDTANAVVKAGIEEMRNGGLSFEGQIQLPTEERAAITVSTEHDDVVATDVYNVLEPLRAKNVLAAAGAKFLTGLVGDVD